MKLDILTSAERMNLSLKVQVTAAKTLDLPDEIREQLHPGDEYHVSVINDEIVLKKIIPLTWTELSQRIESVGVDPEQPTLQEISDMVKEVREERRLNHEDRSGR
jgi:hypothetical protein